MTADKFLPMVGKIIRHARRVQRELGPGHAEMVYHRALLHELRSSGETVQYQPRLNVWYGGQVVGEVIPDLVVRKGPVAVLVECKAAGHFEQADFDQIRRYLRAYQGEAMGLLLGFGGERLEFRRVMVEKAVKS
uniref:GxxExxY protein n=1 Tax=Bellilinea caldifistulae TaxID=360411 RepID=A0A7C4L328_9CHLR